MRVAPHLLILDRDVEAKLHGSSRLELFRLQLDDDIAKLFGVEADQVGGLERIVRSSAVAADLLDWTHDEGTD